MVHRDGGEQIQPPVLWRPRAHIEDSVAPAEYVAAGDLEAKLAALGKCNTPAKLLERAWLYYEHPLATPSTETDDEFFDLGNRDLQQILTGFSLSPRDPRRFGASMLKAYEPSFRLRAADRNPGVNVPSSMRTELQENLGTIMLDYLDGTDLTEEEHGRLAELIVGTYLIDGNFFPFIASRREEANIFPADNHDYYNIHKYGRNKVRKVPISVKYRAMRRSQLVATLVVGKLTLQTARSTALYCEEEIFQPGADEKEATAKATRLAADIMVCHTQGDELAEEDHEFRKLLTKKMSDIIVRFTVMTKTPDYAKNAALLKAFQNQTR